MWGRYSSFNHIQGGLLQTHGLLINPCNYSHRDIKLLGDGLKPLTCFSRILILISSDHYLLCFHWSMFSVMHMLMIPNSRVNTTFVYYIRFKLFCWIKYKKHSLNIYLIYSITLAISLFFNERTPTHLSMCLCFEKAIYSLLRDITPYTANSFS